jgi:hypothetical protein
MAHVYVNGHKVQVEDVVKVNETPCIIGMMKTSEPEKGVTVSEIFLKWDDTLHQWCKVSDQEEKVKIFAKAQGWSRQELKETWGYDFPELDE